MSDGTGETEGGVKRKRLAKSCGVARTRREE